jgi:acyl-CoA synthetase (AMP-forming)/AMP-acid ligase II
MSATTFGGFRLDSILTRAAQTHPQRQGVIFLDSGRTYAEVNDRAARLAGALAGLGVGKGDRVALWIPNRPEFVETLFGVSKLGAIAVLMDFWWTWDDAQAALGQTRPKVLLVGASQATLASAHGDAIAACGIEQVLYLEDAPSGCSFGSYANLVDSATPLGELTPVQPEDPAVIFFTSGSTGRSKGAVHTHGSLIAAATTMCLELGLHDGERTLHFLPLFTSCMEHLIPLTLMRATHVILPKFDAGSVWEAVHRHSITHFNSIPTTLRRILDVAPAKTPGSLRLISYASERMPTPLITALLERMPEVQFVQFYGMTEQLCLTVLDHSDHLRKIGTIGRPMTGAELYLRQPDGDIQVASGAGEIVGRSPTLFAGYWQDEAATAQVMLDGWLRTGDLGHFDEDGFLTLDGRAKEMIKSGGHTVIPSEVEGVLTEHPNVSEAAVVGIPDDSWGEAVHAFVILVPGTSISDADLKSFCKERLASYKTPKGIHVVKELPKTGIGKIARRQVRDQILALLETA